MRFFTHGNDTTPPRPLLPSERSPALPFRDATPDRVSLCQLGTTRAQIHVHIYTYIYIYIYISLTSKLSV